MKKIIWSLLLVTLLFLTGCTEKEPGYFLNPPGTPIDATLIDNYGFAAEFTPMGEIRAVEPVKLVGANFIGTTLDTNFWQINTANGGTVTQTGGAMLVQPNATANGTAYVSSVRRGRYIAGSSMRYRAIIQNESGLANNQRRWGVTDWATLPTITDGAYFKLNGTTLSVCTMKGGIETPVSSGSFNGVYGPTYSIPTTVLTYEIYWTNSKIFFVISDKNLHMVTASNATWTNTATMYLWADNVNSGGLATNKVMSIRVMSISRLGAFQSAPVFKHISSATTTICKYGAGSLHTVVLNNPTNNAITIYDNIAGSGTVIAVINPGSSATPFDLHYDLDFSTGLTIVTAGSADITCIYE